MTEWNEDHRDEPIYDEPGGTGKVLFYFFAVVVLCAVSVGIGYMMGRKAAPAVTDATASSSPAPAASGAAKPGAARGAAEPAETPSPSMAEMTPASPTPDATPEKKPAKAGSTAKPAAKAPEMATKPGTGIMVQVAAVTRQEDADTLANALRKKQYPVFILPASGGDKYYHVQVGPFAELKDAEAMKTKLAGDGYNAIVKK